MRELRPHIAAVDFAPRVLHPQAERHQLAFLESSVDRCLRVEGAVIPSRADDEGPHTKV